MKRCFLSAEESDYIEDVGLDVLLKVIRENDSNKLNGAYITYRFKYWMKWYLKGKPRLNKTPYITKKIESTIYSSCMWFDPVEYTGCPYPELVYKIMATNGNVSAALTERERKIWNRKAKAAVERYLINLYNLEESYDRP